MKFEFEGRTRELDMEDVLLSHSLKVTEHTGGSLEAWETALATPEGASPAWLKALQAAYWLMLAQAGEAPGKITDCDFAVLKFGKVLAQAWKEELEATAEVAEDPTRSGAGDAGTSPPPRASAGSRGSGKAT